MNKHYEKGKEILKKLLDSGYQAFFVGGFVRDYLLGIETNDIDITTDAKPSEIQTIFTNTKATGLRYGTITVFNKGHQYEVTTFREDGEYLNFRQPERVEFSNSLDLDLKRRDFTINSLAMDYDGRIIDLFNGKKDLEKRIIRAIGDPNQRFQEDALRILRAFRFVSKLGFDIEPLTLNCIKTNIALLKMIANERVIIELKKVFSGEHYRKAVLLMTETNIGEAYPELKQGLFKLSKIDNYNINFLEFVALCFYFYESDIPDTWRFSNKERTIIDKIIELVNVMENDKYNEMIIYRLGKEIPLMANSVSRIINQDNDQSKLINIIYNNLPIYKTCDLKFKGQDILELTTLRNAEIIGEIIDDITYEVITNKLPNDYDAIKDFTMQLLETKYGKR